MARTEISNHSLKFHPCLKVVRSASISSLTFESFKNKYDLVGQALADRDELHLQGMGVGVAVGVRPDMLVLLQ